MVFEALWCARCCFDISGSTPNAAAPFQESGTSRRLVHRLMLLLKAHKSRSPRFAHSCLTVLNSIVFYPSNHDTGVTYHISLVCQNLMAQSLSLKKSLTQPFPMSVKFITDPRINFLATIGQPEDEKYDTGRSNP